MNRNLNAMKRILIVEDNPNSLELAVQLLEDDFSLLQATDGQSAVEMTLKESPDLVLMDLSLPRMDGWTAVKEIRRDERGRKIPIIALTAHAIKGDRERVLSAGFDAYVPKPIDEEVLFAAIKGLLRG